MNERRCGGGPNATTLRSAGRGLDWLNLFVANIQTGFGPFIAIYLTTQGWTQTAIGFALSLGTITSMASQVPAGAVVDATARKSWVAALSILVFTGSALIFALRPTPLFVYLAEMLHGFSSCTLGPAIAAMSLAVAERTTLGLRLGRNVRYASIGNGVGAALLGACGYLISNQAVFFLTAALTLPALAALVPLSRLDASVARGAPGETARRRNIADVLANPRLLIFAACATLFTLANAAMLPLASVALTKRAGDIASLLIAACVVLPQVMVALLSPQMGRVAETRGRRLVLLLGFLMLPLRGVLFALVTSPPLVVVVQALDGIAATSFGIMVPLIAADVAGRSGHFNLALGFVGFAIGIGATLSTALAGWIGDRFGDPVAFAGLGAIGAMALLLVWYAMPETRPAAEEAGA
jgi:MFS family permease